MKREGDIRNIEIFPIESTEIFKYSNISTPSTEMSKIFSSRTARPGAGTTLLCQTDFVCIYYLYSVNSVRGVTSLSSKIYLTIVLILY